jgi:DNA-directed RNA polymerase specialized sigma24 family protein
MPLLGLDIRRCRHVATGQRLKWTKKFRPPSRIRRMTRKLRLGEKDRDELLRRALTQLSPEHRQVIDLVYYHDKSVDEVAHRRPLAHQFAARLPVCARLPARA